VGGLDHTQAACPRERDPLPIVQEADLTPGSVWTIDENVVSIGVRYPTDQSVEIRLTELL